MSTAKQWEQLADEAIADAGEWKARARKAEAAQAEMLEALSRIIAQVGNPDYTLADIVNTASAAIAKATGGDK